MLVPHPPRRRPWQGAALLALFTVVFAIRLLDRSRSDPLGELYVVPILAAAWWFGAVGALLGVATGLGLILLWEELLGGHVTAAGFAIRATILISVGVTAGAMVDRVAAAVRTWDALLRASPDAVVAVDENGRVIEMSDRATKLFGYREEEMLGRPLDVILPDTVSGRDSGAAGHWTEPRLRPVLWGRTMTARLASGEDLPVEVNVAPVVRRGHLGALATVRDISARIRAEEDVRRSEARFRGALDTMLDPFLILGALRDTRGVIVDFLYDYVNAAAAVDHHLPAAELMGRTLLDLRPNLAGSPVFDAYVAVVTTGKPLVLQELPYEDTVGPSQRRFFDVHSTRLGDGVACTWRDVTAGVEARAQLRQAARRFEAAFDRAPAGVALIGLDLVIRQANPAFADMLGLSPDALTGHSLLELTDSPTSTEAIATLADLGARYEAAQRTDLRLTGSYGQPVWVSLSAGRVPDEMDLPGYLVVHAENVSARREYEERLVYMASHDGLTGLLNRRQFVDDLDRHLSMVNRYGGGGALVLLDLDNFKYVNDTLGHAAGDEVIRGIATTLRGRLRDTDLLARLGGDEFAVLVPVADETSARHLADSLLEATRGGVGSGTVTGRIRTSASAGVVVLGPDSGSATEVLALADVAMYAAKDEGRDCVVVYDPHSPHLARWHARFRWIDRIREALEKDEFTLYAQPILRLHGSEITHYELLLRMRTDGELVGPGHFLYIAEQHGLARPIDRWVVQEAIRLAAQYPGPPGRRFEVNLSAESLGDPDLPDLVAATLRHHEVDPRRLIFEITETAAISNFGAARAFVQRITDLGCGFALDDFGAGYGSFYNLKHLPLQYLKIDGEFIRQLPASRTDQLIVQAVVEAAHGLGKQTIAEYVTDQATLDVLREYGVDFAQGYHVGRPVDPATAFGGRR
ncbi:MAG TPA: EAL domain-containing protein [Acidimicrobiales bacterium]|nr:EAL domain-containing protein [Acidimicrobiales bacterium]